MKPRKALLNQRKALPPLDMLSAAFVLQEVDPDAPILFSLRGHIRMQSRQIEVYRRYTHCLYHFACYAFNAHAYQGGFSSVDLAYKERGWDSHARTHLVNLLREGKLRIHQAPDETHPCTVCSKLNRGKRVGVFYGG